MTNKENNNKKRNIIIIGILLLLLLCVTLGSAYLTQMLQINGTTNIAKSSWDIHFANEAEQEGSVTAREPLTIDTSKTLITFGITFTKPGEFYEFEVDTVNDGAMDAMVNRVTKVGISEENAKYISFETTYSDGAPIKQYDLLAQKTSERIKVRVEFKEVDSALDLPSSDLDLDLELQIEYTQSDENAHEREEVKKEPAILKASFLAAGDLSNFSVTRGVKRIIFSDKINTPEDAIATADFSEAKDGRIIAYTVLNAEDNTKYDLHIEGDGSLYANPNSSNAFAPYSNVEEIIGANKLNTSLITNMSSMFISCTKLVSIDDTSNWDLSNVTNMSSTFQNTTSLKLIGGSGNWNLSNVTSMSYAFQNSGIEYLEAYNWGLENLINLSYTFQGASSLISLGENLNWNLSNVENMVSAFEFCEKLERLDASNWNLNKVQNMYMAFYENNALTTLGDTSGWHLNQVTNMNSSFFHCYVLESLDASNWGLENVEDMGAIFAENRALKTLGNTKGWNLNKVKNLSQSFNHCYALIGLDTSNWGLGTVTDVTYAFGGDENLTTLGDTSNWSLANLTMMKGMFTECKKIKSLKTTNWDTSKVTNFQQTFQGLENITDFDISNIDFTSATITERMFSDSPNISGTLNFNGTKIRNFSNMFTILPRSDEPDFVRNNPIIVNYISANEAMIDTIIGSSFNHNTEKGTLIS